MKLVRTLLLFGLPFNIKDGPLQLKFEGIGINIYFLFCMLLITSFLTRSIMPQKMAADLSQLITFK